MFIYNLESIDSMSKPCVANQSNEKRKVCPPLARPIPSAQLTVESFMNCLFSTSLSKTRSYYVRQGAVMYPRSAAAV